MNKKRKNLSRRGFVKTLGSGVLATTLASPLSNILNAQQGKNVSEIYDIHTIPDQPFLKTGSGSLHVGIESLLHLMGVQGLKFYRSETLSALSGPDGLIAPGDVVLIKVNAQWKYRGCTNSDLIRGLIQRVLEHPDGFSGEVVIFENGQGRGSLKCDSSAAYGDSGIHANANNENHTFLYLVDHVFADPRVSSFLLDPLMYSFIDENDHKTDGFRLYENVSYPCFTTDGGHRVELKEGIWNGKRHNSNLKLINVPVLKHHDVGGSEITGALKHFYGVLSMRDGYSPSRHYNTLGDTCGRMVAAVCTPVLNIMDSIWVSQGSLAGYPETTTTRANRITASQDPVALDYWTAKHILYPIDNNTHHHPEYPGILRWLEQSKTVINTLGGLKDPSKGILVDKVTYNEGSINVFSQTAAAHVIRGRITLGGSSGTGGDERIGLSGVIMRGLPGDPETDNAGRFKSAVLAGWSGTAIPEKRGYTFMPEQRSYTDVQGKHKRQDFQAFKAISAPLDLSGRRVENRGLFVREHLIILNWSPNPDNAAVPITAYRVYDTGATPDTFLAEVSAGTFEYMQRAVTDTQSRTYEVVAVDGNGRESVPATVTV